MKNIRKFLMNGQIYFVYLARVVLLFLLLFSVGVIAADNTKPVELVTWDYPIVVQNTQQLAQLRVFQEFIRNNPDIKIVVGQLARMPGGLSDNRQLLFMYSAAGSGPHVISPYSLDIGTLIDQRLLVSLGHRIVHPNQQVEYKGRIKDWPYKDEIADMFWKRCGVTTTVKDGTVDTEVFLLPPRNIKKTIMLYNRRMFERYGLNHPPKNWDELFKYALIMASDVDNDGLLDEYGFSINNGGWMFANFVWQAGGEMAREDQVGNLKATYDEPPAVVAGSLLQVFQFCKWFKDEHGKSIVLTKALPAEYRDSKLSDLYIHLELAEKGKPGIIALTDDDVAKFAKKGIWQARDGKEYKITRNGNFYEANGKKILTGVSPDLYNNTEKDKLWRNFVSAKLGMALNAGHEAVEQLLTDPSFQGELRITEEDIGLAPLPSYKKDFSMVGFQATGITVRAKTSNEIDAAWKLATWLVCDKSEKIITDTFVESGNRLGLNPIWLKRHGYPELYAKIPSSWIKAWSFKDDLSDVKMEPGFAGWLPVQFREIDNALQGFLMDPHGNPKQKLTRNVDGVNKSILKYEPPGQNKWPLWLQFTMIGLLIIGFIAIFIWMGRMMMSGQLKKQRGGFGSQGRLLFISCIFLVPAMLTVAIWQYYPVARGMLMAFQDYKVMGGSSYVGLRNFIAVFTKPTFFKIVFNTFEYVLLSIGLGFIPPIVLALLISEINRFRTTYLVIFYAPAIMVGVIMLMFWMKLYDPSPEGFLNQILGYFGYAPQAWLADPTIALICIIVPGIWAGAGPGSIIYLAALKSVPDDLYEAADIDGASIFSKIWNIAFPTIMPLLIINFLGAFIGAFHAAGNILVMTGGGPDNATTTVGLEIFVQAFMYLNYGYGTALAWMLGSTLIGFTILQLNVMKRLKYSAGKGE